MKKSQPKPTRALHNQECDLADLHAEDPEKVRAELAAHKAVRPSNRDIPALTKWALAKDSILTRLQLAEVLTKGRWRKVDLVSADLREQTQESVR